MLTRDTLGARDMADQIGAEYREQVRSVFAGDTSGPVFNGTMEHASIVIDQAFRQARSSVRILSNRLESGCYGRDSIVEAAKGFLDRSGTTLELLVEDWQGGLLDGRFLQQIAAHGGDRVKLRGVDPQIVKLYSYNFMLVDGSSYRFEEDRELHVAVVAGGPKHSSRTNRLIEIWDRLQQLSVELTVPLKTPLTVQHA